VNSSVRRGVGGGPWTALATLVASAGTLMCCAMPAAFVALGGGAALVSLLGAFPQLIWLSEHKAGVFTFAALMLVASVWIQTAQRRAPCPADPRLRDACLRTRRFSGRVLMASTLLFLVGSWFAFVQPLLSA